MSKEKIAQLLDDKRFKNYHYNTSEPIVGALVPAA